MAEQRPRFTVTMAVAVVAVVGSLGNASAALRHTVGDSRWAIPPFPNFYRIWSSLHFFQIGDSLLFDFDTGYYNVVQVSWEEYSRCTSDNPLEIYNYGPAIVLLSDVGVFYYICNVSNYCDLGQRLSVIVHNNRFHPFPFSPPPPLPPPMAAPPPSSGATNCSLPPRTTDPLPEPRDGGEAPISAQHNSVSSLSFGWALFICLVQLFFCF